MVEEHRPNGARRSATYFMGGEKVGFRQWDKEGHLEFEYALQDGVKHGHEYRFHPNGQLLEKETYRRGQLHGTGRQWAEDGRLLVTWKMVNSTGLDLWCDEDGNLAEEGYWPRPGELGYRRDWNGDEQTVWREYFYVFGVGYQGVWREWNARGRLRRGFPRYYVNDRQVTKRQYLKACESDPTLPPLRPEENDSHRQLPAAYVAQKKRRRNRP